MPSIMTIWFGDRPFNFAIENTPVAELWLERMSSRHAWPLDDPRRFYHFNSDDQEIVRAEQQLKQCITTINRYQSIIDRPFTRVDDQDLLNYLHNVFECYHGMLDQQDHEFWNQAPQEVRQALADLNLAVHRCESLRAGKPRLVCTWFGMPKIKRLNLDLQAQYGRLDCEFGAVYLNYVEIGKTAQDLARDNDRYIADEMFQPFDHYSADFVVTFYNKAIEDSQSVLDSIQDYWREHRDFFQKFAIDSAQDVRMMPYRFKVAQLQYTAGQERAILDIIRDNQMVTLVEIT